MSVFRKVLASSVLATALAAAGVAGAAPSVATQGGATTVALDADFTGALDSLGVALGLTGNASASAAGVAFPIPAGAIDVETAVGEIIHTGGITLGVDGLTVALTTFTIDTTGDAPVLTGLVKANGDLLFRAPLFDVELPAGFTLPIQASRLGVVRLDGVTLTLNAAAADLLNDVFGVDAFVEGFPIGTASVTARTLPFR